MYQARMSGPFFDRFDVKVFCTPPLMVEKKERGTLIKNQVREALHFRKTVKLNWQISGDRYFSLPKNQNKNLNYRTIFKIKRVAETLAYLEKSKILEERHLDEAQVLQKMVGLQ